MKNKLLPILTVLIVLFGFISCPDKDDKDIAITLNSVTADGSVTETTTKLILTFNQEIIGLSANDISITGIDGVIKGTLTNSGASYTLPISGFSQGGTLSIAVSKTGYAIIGSPKNVMIYFDPILKSVEMQVYNTDKTTPYTGEDLNFFIQGDLSKTLAATIRDGKLVIRYIPLPAGLSTATFDTTGLTQITEGLQRFEIILITDNSKKLKYIDSTTSRLININYYNKNGSFVFSNSITHSIKEGWNFTQMGFVGSSTNPADAMFASYRWIIENL